MELFVEPFLMSIEEAVKLAEKYDVGLEIYLDATRVDKLLGNNGNNVIKKLMGLKKVSIHGPAHDLPLGSQDNYIREAVARRIADTIKVGERINAKWVLFHTGLNPLEYWHPNALEKWIKNAVNFLSTIVENYQIKIRLENTFERNPYIFTRIFKEIDELEFCLDIGHLEVYSNASIEEWVRELSDRIREVHLHNNDKEKDLHMPLNEGKIDIKKAMMIIEDYIDDYVITLEPINEENLVKDIKWLKENDFL